jgi:hypothetical protein
MLKLFHQQVNYPVKSVWEVEATDIDIVGSSCTCANIDGICAGAGAVDGAGQAPPAPVEGGGGGPIEREVVVVSRQ